MQRFHREDVSKTEEINLGRRSKRIQIPRPENGFLRASSLRAR